MADIEIAGIHFRTGRMNTIDQFHVGRRVMPLFSKLGPALARPTEGATPQQMESFVIDAAGRFVDAIGTLEDAECNYVLDKCLSICSRKQGDTWAPIWNSSVMRLMFEDIDMVVMLRLCFTVLQENLGAFFPDRLATGSPS